VDLAIRMSLANPLGMLALLLIVGSFGGALASWAYHRGAAGGANIIKTPLEIRELLAIDAVPTAYEVAEARAALDEDERASAPIVIDAETNEPPPIPDRRALPPASPAPAVDPEPTLELPVTPQPTVELDDLDTELSEPQR
jgi:hypothetical protein